MKNETIFSRGERNPFSQYFSGESWLNMLTDSGVAIASVTFAPRCRNNWHIHQGEGGGQILLCISGSGWYCEYGKKARALSVGDVVQIPQGVKHWHGAAKESTFVHLAVEIPCKGGSTLWCEPVSDDEYNQLP